MLQGIPARIAERLWPREQVMESQRKRLLDAMAHALAERGLRGQQDHERGSRRGGRSTSRELFNGVEDLSSLETVGALSRSVDERADDEAGHVTVVSRHGSDEAIAMDRSEQNSGFWRNPAVRRVMLTSLLAGISSRHRRIAQPRAT